RRRGTRFSPGSAQWLRLLSPAKVPACGDTRAVPPHDLRQEGRPGRAAQADGGSCAAIVVQMPAATASFDPGGSSVAEPSPASTVTALSGRPKTCPPETSLTTSRSQPL